MKDATAFAVAQSPGRRPPWGLSARGLFGSADEFSLLLAALSSETPASTGFPSLGLPLTRLALLQAAQAAAEREAQQSAAPEMEQSAAQSTAASASLSIAGRWPVVGLVTSSFGHRDAPGLPSNHTGIDIAVPTGTSVTTTADGVVKWAGWQSGYGNAVEVEHANGVSTFYAHNSEILVQPGETVRQGQAIARSGSTGLSTGPHVHYEVRVDGKAVDPQSYLQQGGRQPELAKLDDSVLRDIVEEPAAVQPPPQSELQQIVQPPQAQATPTEEETIPPPAPPAIAGPETEAPAEPQSASAPAIAASAESGQTAPTAAVEPALVESPRSAIDQIIFEASQRFGLDEGLLRSVIQVESGFDAAALSPSGAKGLMQLMDATARGLGVRDSFDPAQNVAGGAKYLRQLIDRFGDVSLALAAYNAGPGRVAHYGGVPPFPETQRFIERVTQHWNEYRAVSGAARQEGTA